ncbi:MAG: permease, partial [Candidatus Omnitrophota bacterium]
HYVPKEYISKHLSIPKKRTIFYSVGLGFLMSACCHGILAISMEIHKKGASGPAVVSFLLASPWANLPITILLFGFFGIKAFLIVFGAIAVALITGLLMQFLDRAGRIEKNRHSVEVEEGFSIWQDILRRFRKHEFSHENFWKAFNGVFGGAVSLAAMVLPWILVGIVLGGLVTTFVPEHGFHHYFGPTLLGLLVTMGVATLLEVCSEGTSPLAFTIYQQTGAFGNAFAFLMGGVVTDVTEIGLVWKNLGPRTALWMLAISLPQVILLGWIFNKI